jgi:diguanylate cyclase (GGDEF)-like protein
VLSLGTAEAFVYDALTDQIGSHLKRLDLMQRIEAANRQLEAMAHTDPLTLLYNRRYLMNQLDFEFKRARRHGLPLSFLIIDLDHFKSINDTHGHLAGDMVLKRVASLLTKSCRGTDLVGRYGGEELCVVLEHTSLEQAVLVAEKLRAAIAGLELASEGKPFAITASIGVAEAAPDDQTVEDLVRRADRALYRAKGGGRNRIERAAFGES